MRRRGTSQMIGEFMVMVSVILIGAPLIGFTFGNLGAFSKPAEVLVSSSFCGPGANSGTVCSFTLTNLGVSSTQVEPTAVLLINHGNVTRTSDSDACAGDAGITVGGGSSLHLSCQFNIAPGTSGDAYSGSVTLANGAVVPFVGKFG
ncbi:MAG: hypothetical protein OK438_00485 [Thaumarchaeota archaeon]|nr:hypothetical protein [Nitrososphaerota archaeon]